MTESLSKIIEAPPTLLGKFSVECVIVGGVAATLHGSLILTTDLDVCYARGRSNLERLANALQSVHARRRNAPDDLPFLLDAETLRRGLIAKRAAGRPKDLIAIPELEALRERSLRVNAQAEDQKT